MMMFDKINPAEWGEISALLMASFVAGWFSGSFVIGVMTFFVSWFIGAGIRAYLEVQAIAEKNDDLL